MSSQYTPLEEITKIHNDLRQTFRSGKTKPLAFRVQQLLQLARMAQDNRERFADALAADLGRPRNEAYAAEIGAVIERTLICAGKLEEWAKEERFDATVPDWQKPWKPTVWKEPKGCALIIGAWNYPMILSLQPLYGAISAGCTAALKLSEISPHYAFLVAELLPKYLDNDAYKVILGEVPEVTKALELKWDHIFYTGNGRIARIVSAAASKHLTPLTLELGGKSPVIIHESCDLGLAARRILWGKINNAGQICVSPDYILIPRQLQQAFIAHLTKCYHEFFPEGPLRSSSYSRIVSKLHFDRLQEALGATKGKIVLGGATLEAGGKKPFSFEPTIVADVSTDDPLMEQEIFGPILPLVPVDDLEEAIEWVSSNPHPLVLYVFASDERVKAQVRERTASGNLVYNDTFQQLAVNALPFGGVGESGYGRQVLKYCYELFTYERAAIDVPTSSEESLQARYPPYTQEKFEIMAAHSRIKIPSDEEALAKYRVNGH